MAGESGTLTSMLTEEPMRHEFSARTDGKCGSRTSRNMSSKPRVGPPEWGYPEAPCGSSRAGSDARPRKTLRLLATPRLGQSCRDALEAAQPQKSSPNTIESKFICVSLLTVTAAVGEILYHGVRAERHRAAVGSTRIRTTPPKRTLAHVSVSPSNTSWIS